MKPSSNRLVPVDAFELRELEELGSKLVSFLDREALLLPSFSPYALEFEIPATNAVEYAGYRVMGKIDRIDVDDRGRAIVIDYKSSLSSDYDLYESQKKGGSLQEGKVQTLVYAQALRRMLGLEIVGALYVGYGRSPKVSGAFGPQHRTCGGRRSSRADVRISRRLRRRILFAARCDGRAHCRIARSVDGRAH